VTISIKVLCADDESSKVIRVSTATLGVPRAARLFPAFQQRLQRCFAINHVREALAEPLDFAGIQFKGAVQIREVKRIQDHAAALANASALMMFMPQPASTPEMVAKSAGGPL